MPMQSKTAVKLATLRHAPLRRAATSRNRRWGFIQHGWAKIVKGPDAFAAILQALHVPFPHLSAYLTISVELDDEEAS
jgi:hypothetical protein